MNRILEEAGQRATWRPDTHCLALDGVRGLAILAVTVYRICKEFDPSEHPALAIVRRFAPIGERSVDLFFVLSGFLITGILLRTKNDPRYFRNFISRRALRIFPLYFLSLAVGLLILPQFVSANALDLAKQHQLFLWTYTSNLRMAWLNEWCFGVFDHFWSLAVEEHFYLIWPAIVLIQSRRSLAIVCIMIVVVVGLARTTAALDSRFDVAVAVATFFRADALAIGSLLAIVLTSGISKLSIRRTAGIALAVTLPVLIAIAISGKRFLEIPNSLCPILAASAMAIVLLNQRTSLAVRCLESLPLRMLGKYSYGMYVFQLPIVSIFSMSVLRSYLPSNPFVASIIYGLGTFGLIFSVACLSFHLFESHFLRLKKVFS